MQRSQKYREMTDEEILQIHSQGAKGEKKWYLDQEIQVRGLGERAEEGRKAEIKASSTPITIGKIIFFVILVSVFLSRFLKKF